MYSNSITRASFDLSMEKKMLFQMIRFVKQDRSIDLTDRSIASIAIFTFLCQLGNSPGHIDLDRSFAPLLEITIDRYKSGFDRYRVINPKRNNPETGLDLTVIARGYIFYKTESVFPPAVSHILLNIFGPSISVQLLRVRVQAM